MDDKTATETASRFYNVTKAIIGIFDATTPVISPEEACRILSKPSGRLSIASVFTSGTDRASKFATYLQENLFPPLPLKSTLTGAILVIYSSGDMTTEEYLAISSRLLGGFPDDIPTIVSLSSDKSITDCFSGTLLVSWETDA